MLDLWEDATGVYLDDLGFGVSFWLHGLIRPHALPQTLCSAIIELELRVLARAVGRKHCERNYRRYR